MTVEERNDLGDGLVADYFTSIREGGFYGWPYAYLGPHADPRIKDQKRSIITSIDRVRYFLRHRHKVSSRGYTIFSDAVVFGKLGVLRLRDIHLGGLP